jgi:hypothetical protein
MKPEYVDAAQTMKDEDVSWNIIFYLNWTWLAITAHYVNIVIYH